jgi:prevent-host-death family protein
MKTISSTEAQKSFGELVNNAIREPIAVTKHTKEVVIIVPSQEYHEMRKAYDEVNQRLQVSEGTATSYLGGAKGLFDSVEAVDRFILNERRSWE